MGLIKKQAEANKMYGAICASPTIALEPHVLLKVYTQHRKQVLLS
jgi:protein deglycase